MKAKNDTNTMLSLRIPKDLKKQIQDIADINERSLNQQIVFYLRCLTRQTGEENKSSA